MTIEDEKRNRNNKKERSNTKVQQKKTKPEVKWSNKTKLITNRIIEQRKKIIKIEQQTKPNNKE